MPERLTESDSGRSKGTTDTQRREMDDQKSGTGRVAKRNRQTENRTDRQIDRDRESERERNPERETQRQSGRKRD